MSRRASSAPRGPSQRQLRVGELVRRQLTDILMRGDLHDPAVSGASVVVSEAVSSNDLKTVTAYISVLGGKDEEAVLKALRVRSKALRHEVMNGLSLKFAPALKFELDRSFDRMDETRRMFSDPKVAQDLDRASEDN
jgi:ribosome-binding factor A